MRSDLSFTHCPRQRVRTSGRSGPGSRLRQGVSTIELVTAASVLGTLLLCLVPLLGRLKQAEAVSIRKALALREARNLVERLQPLDAPELPELPERLGEYLPQVHGELKTVQIPADQSELSMNRHTVVLSWTESSGVHAVQLSWWKPVLKEEGQ